MEDQFVVDFVGQSGRTYRYYNTPSLAAADLRPIAGNYIFSYHAGNGRWPAVYVGQCDDFKRRLPWHERLADAKRAGATHVLTRANSGGEQARLAEEQDLILNLAPPLNTHGRAIKRAS